MRGCKAERSCSSYLEVRLGREGQAVTRVNYGGVSLTIKDRLMAMKITVRAFAPDLEAIVDGVLEAFLLVAYNSDFCDLSSMQRKGLCLSTVAGPFAI